jgi:hypothetical protein
MKSFSFRLGLATAAVALLAAPAMAQKPGESGSSPAADRPVAVERGQAVSSNSGARTAPSSAASVGSSAISASSPSAASAAMPTMGFGTAPRAAYREEAPQHRTQGSSASSGQAVPRGSSGGSSSGSARPAPSASSGGSSSSTHSRQAPRANRDGGSAAVPHWARPRGDRPRTDTAVQRTTPRPDRHGFVYGRYYDPFGFYYGSPYYYGDYYSPFFYSPYTLGYGFGLGFPWMDPWSDPFYYGGGGGYEAYSQGSADDDQGSLRLKIKPRDAKVYVDNYFVGTVDSMDGVFQKLPLNGGRHRVTVKADGYEPEEFDVVITPNETATYAGDLKKIK